MKLLGATTSIASLGNVDSWTEVRTSHFCGLLHSKYQCKWRSMKLLPDVVMQETGHDLPSYDISSLQLTVA